MDIFVSLVKLDYMGTCGDLGLSAASASQPGWRLLSRIAEGKVTVPTGARSVTAVHPLPACPKTFKY